MILKAFPFTFVTLILYHVLFLFTDASLTAPLMSVWLPSGDTWSMSLGDLIIALGIGLLFLDLLSATSVRTASVINHGLSLVVFVIAFVEFLLVPGCGTAVFFLIMLIALLDVIAGYTITIMAARRDIAFEDAPH